MAYCQHCGAAITSDARFCAYCGSVLQALTEPEAVSAPAASQTIAVLGDCSVILLSLGRCSRAEAARLIMSACGYSQDEALLLADSSPVTLVQDLPRAQAVCLAQALTEKNMEVALRDGSDYQELVETDDDSLFDKLGNFIASAAAALGRISARHRIPRPMIRRMDLSHLPAQRPPVLRVQHRHAAPAPLPARPARAVRPLRTAPRQTPRPQPGPAPDRPERQQPGHHQRHDKPGRHSSPR